MRLTRRAFLERTSLVLSAIGFSDLGLSVLTQYQQALAQPTRRKLALLVGINQYPEQVCDYVPTRGSALNGCLTDVAMQRELLIHRFGFQSNDVLTLTDQQATRQAIEEAFLEHLTQQARPGDVVVFHFSGLGSRVKLNAQAERTYNSLVPIDGVLPTEENPAIHDVLLETLGLLVRSLPTDQVTTVLDLSYLDPNRIIPINLRVRSRPSIPTGQPNETEVALQDQLLSQLKFSREAFVSGRIGQLPGVVITAAQASQGAIEVQWSGFSAGLLTYALTQHLWQVTPATTVWVDLSRVAATVNQVAGAEQHPQLSGVSGVKGQDSNVTYHLNPHTPGAEGVVTAIDPDGKIQLWMGGLPGAVIDYYGGNSLLTLVPTEIYDSISAALSTVTSTATATEIFPMTEAGLLQVRSRDGLVFKARLLNPNASSSLPQVGQWVQETVRLLPRNISLSVALDSTLERIERVDATSAFAAISKVSTAIAAEQPIDYVFGRLMPETQTVATLSTATSSEVSVSGNVLPSNVLPSNVLPSNVLPGNVPSGNSAVKARYGLFNLGRVVVPNTLTSGDEAVKTAVNRLTPQLRSLLAMKLLRLIANAGSSRLGVRAMLEIVAPQERVVLQQESSRAGNISSQQQSAQVSAADGEIPAIAIGSQVRYRLHNDSDRPIYFTLLGFDTQGGAIALYPVSVTSVTELATDLESANTKSNTATDQATAIAPTLNPNLNPTLDQMAIAPAATLLLPSLPPAPTWVVNGPSGIAEIHIVCSRAPLTQYFAMLNEVVGSSNTVYRVGALPNALEVVQALLQDLHEASVAMRSSSPDGVTAPPVEVTADSYWLSVEAWASLGFMYQVTTNI